MGSEERHMSIFFEFYNLSYRIQESICFNIQVIYHVLPHTNKSSP